MGIVAKPLVQSDYVEVTVHFKCNLGCAHCMIEGMMDWLRPESDQQLARVCAENAQTRRWKGLTLTGAEVTLRRDLPDLARHVRASGFQHVRIQTHGMKLADPAYCRELVEAGIDEYFVSVTAADAATHDELARKVNEKLVSGYKLFGRPFLSEEMMYQAVTKQIDEIPRPPFQ